MPAAKKSSRPLAVYGWTSHVRFGGHYRQGRIIVAAASFAAAVRAADAAGLHKPTKDYCGRTANPVELEVAVSQPGQVFASDGVIGSRAASSYRPVANGRVDA